MEQDSSRLKNVSLVLERFTNSAAVAVAFASFGLAGSSVTLARLGLWVTFLFVFAGAMMVLHEFSESMLVKRVTIAIALVIFSTMSASAFVFQPGQSFAAVFSVSIFLAFKVGRRYIR